MFLARVVAALPLIVQASGGVSSNDSPSMDVRMRAVVRALQPQLEQCSKLASDRAQMGDVMVSLDKAKSKHLRREYRAIGVDGGVPGVRGVFEDHQGSLTNAVLDISVDHYSYREDIPLGVKRLLFPVTDEFFRQWDHLRWMWVPTPWAELPADVELTDDGCLVLPKTKRLGYAHADWRLARAGRWSIPRNGSRYGKYVTGTVSDVRRVGARTKLS